MAPPSFLNTGFAFTSLASVTDVQDIINAVVTMITTTLSATATNVYPNGEQWTSLGGGVYKSPVDAGGRFMKITIARTTAVRMRFQIEDPTGVIVDGEMDISAAGSNTFIYGGPGHLYIEANNAGTWENAGIFMTDPTPEPLASTTVYVCGRSFRRASDGAALANASNGIFWSIRYYGGTVTGPGLVSCAGIIVLPAQDNANTHLRTQAGSDIACPLYFVPNSALNQDDNRNAGKLYQIVQVDAAQVAGVDLNIPIDTGVTGAFRVARLGPSGPRQFAVRKG